MLLNKQAILAVSDLPSELVEVPQWGGQVMVRGMNAGERDKFEEQIRKHGMDNLRSVLASLTITDESGKRMFSDSEINKLAQKSAGALDIIVEVASRLSGLLDEDIEVLEGN